MAEIPGERAAAALRACGAPVSGPLGEGTPALPGVTADAAGVNVAVVAPEAWSIELCLFDAAGCEEIARHRLPARTGEVWHGHIPGIAPGARYGLRAHGPWSPERGQRFDPT